MLIFRQTWKETWKNLSVSLKYCSGVTRSLGKRLFDPKYFIEVIPNPYCQNVNALTHKQKSCAPYWKPRLYILDVWKFVYNIYPTSCFSKFDSLITRNRGMSLSWIEMHLCDQRVHMYESDELHHIWICCQRKFAARAKKFLSRHAKKWIWVCRRHTKKIFFCFFLPLNTISILM